jgi:hypothetical protein
MVNELLQVPYKCIGNRESDLVQKWEDGGNIPEPFDPYYNEGLDLEGAKSLKIKLLRIEGRKVGMQYIDPHLIKLVDPDDATPIPQEIRDFKKGMKERFTKAKEEINALTTKQEVSDYIMHWGDRPKEAL